MKHLLLLTALLTATTAHAEFRLSRTYMNFGTVRENFSQSHISRLTNTGNKTIRVRDSHACGTNFSVSANCGTLQPGDSCSIWVRYHPYREGLHSCTIRFSDSTGHFDSIRASGRCVERFQEE